MGLFRKIHDYLSRLRHKKSRENKNNAAKIYSVNIVFDNALHRASCDAFRIQLYREGLEEVLAGENSTAALVVGEQTLRAYEKEYMPGFPDSLLEKVEFGRAAEYFWLREEILEEIKKIRGLKWLLEAQPESQQQISGEEEERGWLDEDY